MPQKQLPDSPAHLSKAIAQMRMIAMSPKIPMLLSVKKILKKNYNIKTFNEQLSFMQKLKCETWLVLINYTMLLNTF